MNRQQISDAVSDLGWRYILGALRASVPVGSLAEASDAAGAVVAVAGPDAGDRLWLDVRRDRLVLTVCSLAEAAVTARETALARQISATLADRGLRTEPEVGGGPVRSVQILEIAIDALDIPAIRPFWKAVLGYADEADHTGPKDPLVDPLCQGPAIWFQQMDRPRPQRNRIHFDISVPHDEAPHRIKAALDAGGRLVDDRNAPAFWVLADAEGNEACVTTWQGRD